MKAAKHIPVHLITLLLGFSQVYAWATTYYLPATLIKIVTYETGYSSLAIIGGFSWALLLGGLSAPKIGSLIEREGGRRPLTAGSLLMGLGLLVLSQTHGLIVWYLGWTLIGLGMALGLFNAAFATIGRLLGSSAKTIIVRVTLISGFATLFWPITTYLNETVGWRTMMIIYAIPHFLLWAPLFFFKIPRWVPDHVELTVSEQPLVTEKIKWVFYLLTSYAILRSMVGTTISVDILTLFSGLGMTAGAAALSASLIGPAQIAARIFELNWGKNFNLLNSSIFWTAVLPLSMGMLILFGTASSSIFAIAYGMSNGFLSITMGVLPMILFGSKGYATMLGKLALPVLVVQAATPILIEPLLERWTAIHVFLLAGIFGLISLGCIILLAYSARKKAAVLLLPETH